jgi:hypothetical protein
MYLAEDRSAWRHGGAGRSDAEQRAQSCAGSWASLVTLIRVRLSRAPQFPSEAAHGSCTTSRAPMPSPTCPIK